MNVVHFFFVDKIESIVESICRVNLFHFEDPKNESEFLPAVVFQKQCFKLGDRFIGFYCFQ